MKKKITLDQISKEAPFVVPDNYFDDLQKNILAKIEEKSEPKIIQLKPKYNWRKWSIAAAASILLVSGLFYQQINKPTINDKPDTESELAIAQITDDQMMQYINSQNIELADLTENVDFETGALEDIYNENIETSESDIEDLADEI